jgi:hypothetical protein
LSRVHRGRIVGPALIVITALVLYPVAFYLYRRVGLGAAVLCAGSLVWALWRVADRGEPKATRRWITGGLLAGFALAVYPAYFAFPAAVLVVILLGRREWPHIGFSWSRTRAAFLYTCALLFVLFVYEIVARVGGISYLGGAGRLSGTITQGSYEEGYVFLWRFLAGVEGPWGILLALLAFGYLVTTVARVTSGMRLTPSEALLFQCCIAMAMLYLAYATQCVVLHGMVFTGRYVHFYLPFVIWAAVAMLRPVPVVTWQRVPYAAALAVSLLSFAWFARDYREVTYPLYVLYEHDIRWENVPAEQKVYETAIWSEWVTFSLPRITPARGGRSITTPHEQRYVLVNFGYVSPFFTEVNHYKPPSGAQAIYRKPHFLAFRSSRFEAYTAAQRRQLEHNGLDVAIYQVLE